MSVQFCTCPAFFGSAKQPRGWYCFEVGKKLPPTPLSLHMRPLLKLFLLAATGTALCAATPSADDTSVLTTVKSDPAGRVAAARTRVAEQIADRFRKAGVAYPPVELFLRAFKREAVLEVWARDTGAFVLIHSFPITSSSGQPGPKRREGDRQVPEGFYTIDRFNPLSSFHLSLRINYPNASDRLLSDPQKPGFDIYIHGGNGSSGCLPLGDDGIEEVYLMTIDAGNHAAVPIHLFPARMSGPEWEAFAAPIRTEQPELARFWAQLQPGFDAFEKTHRLPTITVEKDGSYRVQP
jgi:murein L,D-transpeptidase YafK